MPSRVSKQRYLGSRSIHFAAIVAASLSATSLARAADFVEPPVFASSNGVLDLLMVALPLPVPSLTYVPPNNAQPLNPTGWVYQICQRAVAIGNACPSGSATVSNYGGTRLALQPGDALKIRLVNELPALDPVKVKHSVDPGGGNLPMNLTNLHTHGLIVEARAPTLADPTFGDYVFVDIYNPANGTPVPQPTHQHGSIVKGYADYRIDIPANHPSGAFWFHPHVHGIALNQISSGLAGIISIGSVSQYAHGDTSNAPFPDANVRHLVLKDLQVLAGGTIMFGNGSASVANGEVLAQEDPRFCNQFPALSTEVRHGSCPGADNSNSGGNDYTGGTWFFTVSGQQYPTITLNEQDGEMWRLTNASGSLSYDLQLMNNVTGAAMVMQLVSVDGVSINVPPGSSLGNEVQIAGARFSVVACPEAPPTIVWNSAPVCINELVMMPSSRAEVWVSYRDANNRLAIPPPAATGVFKMIGLTTGAAGDSWPAVDLARVSFTQTATPSIVASAINIFGGSLAAGKPGGIFVAKVRNAKAAAAPAGCKALPAGHHRRIFFGLADYTNPASFGLGYEEIDQHGVAVAGTQVPITQFDPSANTVCLPLGPGQTPVHETWELVNLATENHNFHMHQTKFRSLGPGPATTVVGGTPIPWTGGILEDNVPLSVAVPKNADYIATYQNGYCTIAQWYSSTCTSSPLFVDIPFSQLGEFVFHCHILEHEDGGMMAKIQVVSTPSAANTHDYNGDGQSDMAWRDQIGNAALWLMNGAAAASTGGFSGVPASWSVVGHRDFDGDGNYDLLWRDTSGNIAIWFLNGTQVRSSAAIGNVPVGWTVVATGDFDGDGKGDILWQDASGNLAMWLMNGAAVASSGGLGNVPVAWSLVGTGDFDGDGKSDLLWRDTGGNTSIWFVNGTEVASMASVGNVPIAWSVVGTGDFDGDGKSDIVWRHGSGSTAIWLMSGATVAASGALGGIPTSWSIVQTGDYNADGKSDLLWRDGSGNASIWFMDGVQVATAAAVGTVPTNWTLQSVNAD
jgi:FtsP/CotA-like multicopper oxidase with cupredoxin domain